MNKKKLASTLLLVASFVTLATGSASAEVTGGNYSLNGGVTSISGSAVSNGGNFTVSSRADASGGVSSGGNYTVTGSTPGDSDESVTTTSSGGGGGGVASQPTLNIESISVQPAEDGASATVTVTFSNPVTTTLLYGATALNMSTPESAPEVNTHTFTLDNLLPNTAYEYEFTAQLASSYNSNSTFQFGTYSFNTPDPAAVTTYVPTYVPIEAVTYAPTPAAGGGGTPVPTVPYNPTTYDEPVEDEQSEVPEGQMERILVGGTITDLAGTPLPGVTVYILESGEGDDRQVLGRVETDQNGNYQILAPQGEYSLYIREGEYNDFQTEIIVGEAEITQNISLNRKQSAQPAATTAVETDAPKAQCTIVSAYWTIFVTLALIALGAIGRLAMARMGKSTAEFVDEFGVVRKATTSLLWKSFSIWSAVGLFTVLATYMIWCKFIIHLDVVQQVVMTVVK